MTLTAGVRIGKYVVRRKIAEGGMAEVYLCASSGPEGFAKDVVIKRIRSHLASDREFVGMFIREANLASKLNHPNLVQIFDFDKHEDSFYLAMEYVPGYSLWDVRRRAKEKGQPIPPILVAHLGAEVARGLGHAHGLMENGVPLGLVHRDISPQNILLSPSGAVKLTDFGIAKVGVRSTAPGVLKGKFSYMAPEQARGDDVDARSDIFALGIVLWELLTGGRLFEADSDLAILRAVQEMIIPPPARLNPDVPEALDAWVMKALQRDPAHRPQTAQEFERGCAEFMLTHAKTVDDRDLGGFLTRLYEGDAGVETSGPLASVSGLPDTAIAPRDEDPLAKTEVLSRPKLDEPLEKHDLAPRAMRPTIGMRRAVLGTAAFTVLLISAALGMRFWPSTPVRAAEPKIVTVAAKVADPVKPPDATTLPVLPSLDAGTLAPKTSGTDPRPLGVLKLHIMPWANVSVAGRRYEASPELTVRLPEGTYRVRMENPVLGWSEQRVVGVHASRDTTLRVSIPVVNKP